MKRSGTEDAVKRWAKWQRQQIGSDEFNPIAELRMQALARMEDHVAREIKTNNTTFGKIFEKQSGQLSRAATSIEDAFITAQAKFAQDALSPLKLRSRKPVILRRVPLAGLGRFGHLQIAARA